MNKTQRRFKFEMVQKFDLSLKILFSFQFFDERRIYLFHKKFNNNGISLIFQPKKDLKSIQLKFHELLILI
jgi:hypothetical protein